MKSLKLFFFFFIISTVMVHAQITKGNWLVGGDASFEVNNSKSNFSSNDGNYSSSNFNFIYISPDIGYFFMDKLAGGMKIQIILNEVFKSNNSQSYGFAPFIKYYFLKPEKEFNIFSELSYGLSFGINGLDQKSRSNNLNIKAGTVVFFNNSVGLELAISYLNSNGKIEYSEERDIKSKRNQFLFGIGLQIHLEK